MLSAGSRDGYRKMWHMIDPDEAVLAEAARMDLAERRDSVGADLAESMAALDGSLTAIVGLLTGLTAEEIADLGGVGEWSTPGGTAAATSPRPWRPS